MAKLLAFTDSHFEGTGINVRAMLAIAFGGICFLPMFGKLNIPFMQPDPRQKDERDNMKQTIRQLVNWAWEAADKRKRASA